MWESQKNDYNDSEFRHTFGFTPNTIRQKIIDIIKNTNDPGLDLEKLCRAIKVAVKLITRIRFKPGTDKYASCGTAEKCSCSTLFSCIRVCEERRMLAENGYDLNLTEDLEVFGDGAVIDKDEFFCDEEEEDDEPDVDIDDYFTDDE